MARTPFHQDPNFLRFLAQHGLKVDATGVVTPSWPGSFTGTNAARLAAFGLGFNANAHVLVELTPDAYEKVATHLADQETIRHAASQAGETTRHAASQAGETTRHGDTQTTNRHAADQETVRHAASQLGETTRHGDTQTTIRQGNDIRREIETITSNTKIELKKIESSTDKSAHRWKSAAIIAPIVSLMLLAGWKGNDIMRHLENGFIHKEEMATIDAGKRIAIVETRADRDIKIKQSDTEARIAEAKERARAAAASRPINNTTYIYQTPEGGSGESSRQTVDVNIRVDNPQQEQAVNQVVERAIQEPVYVNNNPQVVQHVFDYAYNNPYYYNQIPYHMYEYCYHHYPSLWNNMHASVRMGFNFGHRRDDYQVDNNTSTIVNNNIINIDNQNTNNNTNTNSSRSSSRSDSRSNSSSSSRDQNRGNGHNRPNRPGQTIPGGDNNGNQTIPGGNNNGNQTIPGRNNDGSQTIPGRNNDGNQSIPGGNNNGNQTIPGRNNDGNQSIPGGNNGGNQNIPSTTRSSTRSAGSSGTSTQSSSRRLTTPSISTGTYRPQSQDRSGSSVRSGSGNSTRSSSGYNPGTTRSGGNGRTQGDRGSSGRR